MIREITVRAVWPEPLKGKQEVRTQASTEPSTSRCVLSLTTASSDVQLWVAYPLRTPPRVGDSCICLVFVRPRAMQAGAVLTIERTEYSTVANLEVFDFSDRGGQITSRPPGCL